MLIKGGQNVKTLVPVMHKSRQKYPRHHSKVEISLIIHYRINENNFPVIREKIGDY